MSMLSTVLEALSSLPLLLQILFFIIFLNLMIAGVFYLFTRISERDEVKKSKRYKS